LVSAAADSLHHDDSNVGVFCFHRDVGEEARHTFEMCYVSTNNFVDISQDDTVNDADLAQHFMVTGVHLAQHATVRDADVAQHFEAKGVDVAHHVPARNVDDVQHDVVMINEINHGFVKSLNNEQKVSAIPMDVSYTIHFICFIIETLNDECG